MLLHSSLSRIVYLRNFFNHPITLNMNTIKQPRGGVREARAAEACRSSQAQLGGPGMQGRQSLGGTQLLTGRRARTALNSVRQNTLCIPTF